MTRWSLNVKATRRPVAVKSESAGSSHRAESRSSRGVWLEMNASTTWRCKPSGSVRQTAGRTRDGETARDQTSGFWTHGLGEGLETDGSPGRPSIAGLVVASAVAIMAQATKET